MTDGPITERGDPRDRISNQREHSPAGRDPADVIREALDFKPHWHGQAEKKDAALAALEDMQQRQRDVADELAHLKYEYRLDMDRGDHLVYAKEWDAFNAWQRGELSFEARAVAAEAALADRPITTQEHHLLLIEIRDLEAALAENGDWRTIANEAGERITELEAALADANQRADQLSGQLADEMGLTEQQRARSEQAEQRADDYADTLREIDAIASLGWKSALENIRKRARAALDRHTTPAPTDRRRYVRLRYDIRRIVIDQWGVTFYEVADLKCGVIFWTKNVPTEGGDVT